MTYRPWGGASSLIQKLMIVPAMPFGIASLFLLFRAFSGSSDSLDMLVGCAICVAFCLSWVWLWGSLTIWVSIEPGRIRWSRWFRQEEAPLEHLTLVVNSPFTDHMVCMEVGGTRLRLIYHEDLGQLIPLVMDLAPNAYVNVHSPLRDMLINAFRPSKRHAAMRWRSPSHPSPMRRLP